MCTMPAPPSTAVPAAAIWSGTGVVKTAPQQAASSMPRPTKPPCIGSRPPPPPPPQPPLPSPPAPGGVQHAASDEAAVHRLVARAAARDQRHLALDRRVGPDHVLVLGVHL